MGDTFLNLRWGGWPQGAVLFAPGVHTAEAGWLEDFPPTLARRLGHDWGHPSAEVVWDECRSLSPMHAGMRYDRLEALGGIQWPCPSEDHPGTPFLHARLWAEDPDERGRPAPFAPVAFEPPLDELTEEFPVRLTTGRRLDSFNTGVQSGGYASPLRRPPDNAVKFVRSTHCATSWGSSETPRKRYSRPAMSAVSRSMVS